MNQEQSESLEAIHAVMQPIIDLKFEKGALEHGGVISDKSDLWLKSEIVNEIVDLYIYLGEAKRRGLL